MAIWGKLILIMLYTFLKERSLYNCLPEKINKLNFTVFIQNCMITISLTQLVTECMGQKCCLYNKSS